MEINGGRHDNGKIYLLLTTIDINLVNELIKSTEYKEDVVMLI